VSDEIKLTVEQRSEFGKGAARRTRKAGKIPAVLYGHGTDPKHLALPAIEFARVIRDHGYNSVLTLDIDGDKPQLALTKNIAVHPLKNYIEHVDLLVVKKGERVSVDVPVIVSGDPAPGTLVLQEVDNITIEVDALNIPEELHVSIEDAEAGTTITAADIELPKGAALVTEGESVLVAVNEAPTAEAMEEGLDTEAAEEPKEAAGEAGGGEAAEEASE
jgi:large subunit ribosomal protein L25